MTLFLSCASAVPYEPVRPSAELAEEMQQLRGIGFNEQVALLRRLSPEKKARYADVLRNFDPALSYFHPNQRREHIPKLLALEDPLTTSYISAEVQMVQHPVLIEDLARWRAPGAVIVWAGLSMSDEAYHHDAPSFIAADMVLDLAASLEEFPAEVRQWAAEVRRDAAALLQRRLDEEARNPGQKTSDPPKSAHRLRELVQRWWKANEPALIGRRYSDLVPGERFLAPSQFLPGISAQPNLPINSGPAETPQPPESISTQTREAASESQIAQIRLLPWQWISIGLGSCALVILVYLHSRRKNRSTRNRA
jgi:hypothetical protein